MFIIEVRSRSVSCSCLYSHKFDTPVLAEKAAFNHSMDHIESAIVDLGLCSITCHVDSILRDEEKPRIHHEDCYNHPDNLAPPQSLFSNQEVEQRSIEFAMLEV